MKKRIYALTSMVFFTGSAAQAGAIMDIVPSSTYPIAIAQNGQTYLTYVVKNNTSRTINSLSIDPAFGGAGRSLSLYVSTNQCGILAPNASCVFVVTMQGINQQAYTT